MMISFRHTLIAGLTGLLMLASTTSFAERGSQVPPTSEEAKGIAIESYLYAYPLVLMEVTRRVMANRGEHGAPMNQFDHKREFPDSSFTDIVRPNADTLYSSLWFDVSKEPLVIRVPDSGGRYYLLPMLDMWTDVFASPGKRTTGSGAQTYAITGPGWKGALPDGVEEIKTPTAMGWVLGRTQTNGKEDYPNVHEFQDGFSATPLGQWGKSYEPPKGTVDPRVAMNTPVEQVAKIQPVRFFMLFAELMKKNPPHANDYPILARMKRIGIEPGKSFDSRRMSPVTKAAILQAAQLAQKKMAMQHIGSIVNGWTTPKSPVGTYGTDYLQRATVAYGGLGANTMEDAIYPTAFADVDGKSLDSAKRYVIHFRKEELPPVKGFWSLTMYNEKQLFTENPLDRYAIGDRDKLRFNRDGSLDLYVQRESPGADKEANWLPAPKSGSYSMNMRLYWPKSDALDGAWSPPPVRRLE